MFQKFVNKLAKNPAKNSKKLQTEESQELINILPHDVQNQKDLAQTKSEFTCYQDNIHASVSFAQSTGNLKLTQKGKDTMLMICKNLENFYFFGIFDSHGSSGKEVSDSLRDFYLSLIENKYKDFIKSNWRNQTEEIELFLKNSVKKAEKYLKKNHIDLKYSGSTIHCIMIIQSVIFILNLGDSRSVLYREHNDEKFAIEISTDHLPINKEERFRIYKHGGVVERFVVDKAKIGPFKIWDEAIENGPGLEVTRAIGDLDAQKLGIIMEPEIQHFDLSSQDSFLVIASNGLWQILHSPQVCYYVQKFLKLHKKNFKKCAQFLIDKAIQKIYQKDIQQVHRDITGKVVYDDMTIIIVSFN